MCTCVCPRGVVRDRNNVLRVRQEEEEKQGKEIFHSSAGNCLCSVEGIGSK